MPLIHRKKNKDTEGGDTDVEKKRNEEVEKKSTSDRPQWSVRRGRNEGVNRTSS